MSDSWVGKLLPAVKLESSQGKPLQLPQDFKGKWVLLYFYPKDDTPGCTKQACHYKENMQEMESSGILVFGGAWPECFSGVS